MSYFCYFGPFLGPNEPFRRFSTIYYGQRDHERMKIFCDTLTLNQVPRALGSSWPKGREDPSCQKGSSGPIDKSTDKIKICLCCKALYSSWVISEERLTKLDRGLRIQWERGRGRGRNITTSLKASKSFSFLFRFSSLNVSL